MTAVPRASAPPLTELVAAARAGDQGAWNAIVDRYAGLVWAVCRQCRLSTADAADVSQTVWLRVVERLDGLREPEAFPGWLVTITRREVYRLSSSAWSSRVTESVDAAPWLVPETATESGPEDAVLAAECRAVLQEAFAGLPEHCRRLITMLYGSGAGASYAEISERLSMPIGGIGPTRSRCLAKLRRDPVFVRWAQGRETTKEVAT